MKTVIQNVKIGIFIGMLVLPSVIWYGTKLLAPDIYEKWDYDLGENRTRAEFPDEFDLENYTGRLEAYYDDHLPFRSGLLSAQQKLSGKLEKLYGRSLEKGLIWLVYGKRPDTVMDVSELARTYGEWQGRSGETETGHGGKEEPHDDMVIFTREADYTSYGYTKHQCRICGEVYYSDFAGKIIDNNYFPPKIVGGSVVTGRCNWLFFSEDDSVSYYRGTNILSQDEMAVYLAQMVRLQELCDQRGIRLQFMILPNKEQVYPEYMPSYEIADTDKRESRFVDYVRENSNVNIIYPIRELKEAGVFWQVYFRYDTHWNPLGGYVGAQALYEALGMPTISLHTVNIAEYDETPGDLFAMGGIDKREYPADRNYFVNYKPEVNITYAEGNKMVDGVYRSKSTSENERKFLFLGDSFRHYMAAYLEKDFSDTVIAHRDNIEEVKEEIRGADILVIEAVERKDEELFAVVEKLIKILEEDSYE